MKALTIWQPWASLIMIGAKPYEFRSWSYHARFPGLLGQRIVIHAAARPVRMDEIWPLIQGMEGDGDKPCLKPEIALPFLREVFDRRRHLPLSHGLGTAILGNPKRGDACAQEFGIGAGNDSDRDDTFNWGWPLTDIKPFEPPVPAQGYQGFWNWPHEVPA